MVGFGRSVEVRRFEKGGSPPGILMIPSTPGNDDEVVKPFGRRRRQCAGFSRGGVVNLDKTSSGFPDSLVMRQRKKV
jgi:hypothetical protein